MASQMTWQGTTSQYSELMIAVTNNCTCGGGTQTCPPHQMLQDQKILDHLAFVRGTRAKFIAHEFDIPEHYAECW